MQTHQEERNPRDFEGIFEPPNLDHLEPNQLRVLADVFEDLARYARDKESATAARLQGQTARAEHFERRCEITYGALPHFAQW
jgi:hypothetical protein